MAYFHGGKWPKSKEAYFERKKVKIGGTGQLNLDKIVQSGPKMTQKWAKKSKNLRILYKKRRKKREKKQKKCVYSIKFHGGKCPDIKFYLFWTSKKH